MTNKGLMVLAGTLVFLIVVLAAVFLVADRVFNRKTEREIRDVLGTVTLNKEKVWQTDLRNLPAPVQKWIENSGMVGREKIKSVRLRQKGEMRTKPDGFWMDTEAVQYFTVEKPAFVWQAKIKAAPLFSIAGKDVYRNGRGSMLVKVLSLFTVADAKGKEMDQGTLLRYLAETVWFPSGVLSPYIQWEPVDAYSARAHMTYGEVAASGIFKFNKNYEVAGFEAERYMEQNGKFSKEIWSVVCTAYQNLNNIRIPVKGSVVWKFKSGDFSWFNWEITEIEYNRPEVY